MQRTQTRMRIGVGLVAMVTVLALVVVMTMAGSDGGGNSVSATGPTPTTEPQPGSDGFLSGITDLEILPGPNAAFFCITRTDHDAGTNRVKTASVCSGDTTGLGDPANVLSGVRVFPNEGSDGLSGPPPPPPYGIGLVGVGYGEYYPGGHAECGNVGTGTCLVTFGCVAEAGAGTFGPNLTTKSVSPDPGDTPDFSLGTISLYPRATIKQCDAGDNTGLSLYLGIPLPSGSFDPAGSSQTSWRIAAGSATDFDGDGCTDLEELNENGGRPANCGNDPFNPTDSNVTDNSGAYSFLIIAERSDLTGGGVYFNCLADLQQTGNGETDGDIVARTFCKEDSSNVINSLGYPGVTGDGYPGGGPAYGAIPAEGAPETDCSRFGVPFGDPSPLDEDADGVNNDGCPSEGFADTDSTQDVLTGFIDTADNTIKIRGCFEDEDASSSRINVYIELSVGRYTGIGTVDIWPLQTPDDCTGSHAWGDYINVAGTPLESFDDAFFAWVRQPGGELRDTDQDGCPNASELRDDPSIGGLRDPYNPYDWYDVNQDGVIDLFTDILGVISHYSLDGAPPYDVAYDRGPPITGGAGSWSRRAPDGVIDLFTDILGVISQYSLTGCV